MRIVVATATEPILCEGKNAPALGPRDYHMTKTTKRNTKAKKSHNDEQQDFSTDEKKEQRTWRDTEYIINATQTYSGKKKNLTSARTAQTPAAVVGYLVYCNQRYCCIIIKVRRTDVVYGSTAAEPILRSTILKSNTSYMTHIVKKGLTSARTFMFKLIKCFVSSRILMPDRKRRVSLVLSHG